LVKLTLLIGAINVWYRIAIGFRSVHPARPNYWRPEKRLPGGEEKTARMGLFRAVVAVRNVDNDLVRRAHKTRSV
jgi:hypothetical protein